MKLAVKNVIVVVLLQLSSIATAQEIIKVVDSISEEDKEHTTAIGKQVAFAGVFPLANPRYTICIVSDKLSKDATPALFQDVVNPLVKWLLKRK